MAGGKSEKGASANADRAGGPTDLSQQVVSAKGAHHLRGWIEHNGGDCPINRDTRVRFLFANGNESEKEYRAGDFLWRKRGWGFDIAAYQIVGNAPAEIGAAWTPKSGGY